MDDDAIRLQWRLQALRAWDDFSYYTALGFRLLVTLPFIIGILSVAVAHAAWDWFWNT